MRDIEFRGKRTAADGEQFEGKWAYGVPLEIEGNMNIVFGWDDYEYIHSEPYYRKKLFLLFCTHNEIDPKTIGQFTGLKDKNEKKIFEGDICKLNASTVFVKYDRFGCPCFVLGDLSNEIDFPSAGADGLFKQIEIIGNIHDNPELLEAE